MNLPDNQEGRLRCFKKLLRNEAERLAAQGTDYIRFKRLAQEWLRSELAAYTLGEICRALHSYVDAGGVIDEQPERRETYAHFRYHYDLRVAIGGRRVYFETVLDFEDAAEEDDLTIVVVNVHDV